MQVHWPLPPDYDPVMTISFLRSKATGLLYQYGGLTVARALALGGGDAVLMHAAFTQNGVDVTLQKPGSGPEATETMLPLVRRILALDEPTQTANQALVADPLIGDLARRSRGKRIIRYPDLYECLVSTIMGQQLSPTATQAIRSRFLDRFGRTVRIDGEEFRLFPAPPELAGAPLEALAEVGVSRPKAAYLQAVAEAAAEGNLGIASFDEMDDGAALEALTRIRGVGRWSAEVALMWGLGRPDVFPSGAPALRDTVGRLTGRAKRPTEEEVRAMAQRWQPWRSYAALYLWQAVD